MAENKISKTQQKEWAKELYIRGERTQKEIAATVGVAEKTIGRWVESEQWDKMRKTLLSTKQEQLHMLYDILDRLNKEGKKTLEDDDPDTNPNSDAIIKITNAIKKLETQTGIGEMIDTGTRFIKFVSIENLELAKEITHWFDLFIQDQLKRN